MRKQQRQLELFKRIASCKIFDAIAALENELNGYERSGEIKNDMYAVKVRLNEVHECIFDLKAQLEEIIRSSERWES